jgi:hypothetical protein
MRHTQKELEEKLAETEGRFNKMAYRQVMRQVAQEMEQGKLQTRSNIFNYIDRKLGR